MTLLDLQNSMDSFSSWRKKELISARVLSENTMNDQEKNFFYRSWVVMQYAHCDRFLKELAKAYLSFLIDNNREKYNSIQREVWLIFNAKERILFGSDKYLPKISEKYSELYDDKFIDSILKKGSFSYQWLRFVFDWLIYVDYDHADHMLFCRGLKRRRDKIAHGEKEIDIDLDYCIENNSKTISLLDNMRESIFASAEKVI